MKINRKKFIRFLGILAITGSMSIVPVIATSCGTSTSSNNNSDNTLIKKNATVVTNFESVLKGLKAGSNMNVAVTSILNTEYSKKQLIEGYDSLENKNSINVTVSGIETQENGWGGNRSYLSWRSENGTIVANVNDFLNSTEQQIPIEVGSLSELKTKLTPLLLTELLKNAGINTDELRDVQLVENSKIGIEKTSDEQSTIDAIHVNVQAKQIIKKKESGSETGPEEPVETKDVKYNLSIPAVSIIYRLDNLKVQLNVNNQIQNSLTNLKIKFGTQKKVENNKKNEVIIPWKRGDSDIKTLSMKEVFKQINWLPQNSTLTDEKIELNSIQIGKDLGIYNVEFSNPQDITQYQIGNIQYQGMSYILDARPINGYTWDDGTTDKIQITLNKMNVNVKDSIVKNEKHTENDPYILEWSKLFPQENKTISKSFPDSVENLKKILTTKESFEEFQNAILTNQTYKNDFKSIYFTVDETSITDWPAPASQKTDEKAYKVVMKFETLPGHIMMDEYTTKPGTPLVFKIVDTNPSQGNS